MPRGESSGLGLAIVQAIAEAHGGRVDLDSTPGAGATFTIVVPTGERPG
jgi:signal transduction histidine kinase